MIESSDGRDVGKLIELSTFYERIINIISLQSYLTYKYLKVGILIVYISVAIELTIINIIILLIGARLCCYTLFNSSSYISSQYNS